MPNKSDGQLQDDVVAELEWDPSVDHADIGVSVNDGVVTLAGYVKSFPQKVAAERAVRRVLHCARVSIARARRSVR